jgi:peptide/nickel transport system substrate-binding protein
MWSKFVNVKLLIAVAVAMSLVAAIACSADEPDAPAAPAAPAAAAAPAATTAPAAPAATTAPAPTAEPVVTGYVPKPQTEGTFWSFAYDGPRPTELKESAWSAALVAQGKLPPVEQRMPAIEDVLIVATVGGIGTGGGTRRTTNHRLWRVAGAGDQAYYRQPDGGTLTPNVMSWSVSDDGRVWTLTLRKGMKWSDGNPFTMEDIKFAWQDLGINKFPDPVSGEMLSIRSSWPPGQTDAITGEKPQFAVVDDLHFTLTFDNPKFTLFDGRESYDDRCQGPCWMGPKHYYSQFHPKYQDKAVLAKMMEDAGKKNWVDLFKSFGSFRRNPDQPTVGSYTLASTSDNLRTQVHNPFFHMADAEGNQLPYIHEWHLIKVESRDVAVFRGLAGETDNNGYAYRVAELPLYVANQKKGDYRIFQYNDPGVTAGFGFNQSWNEDPEIGKWIRTRDFRTALSHASNREIINQVAYLGLGTPRQFIAHPDAAYYPGAEYETKDVALDIAKANSLLDGLGLTAKDDDGFRLRSDGSGDRLSLTAVLSPSDPWPAVFDILISNWAKVGIEMTYTTRSDWWRPIRENEEYIGSSGLSWGNANPWYYWPGPLQCQHEACHIASGPGKWKNSKGSCSDAWCRDRGVADATMLPLAPAGNYAEDVSGNIAKMQDLWVQGDSYATGSAERIAIGQELFKIHALEKYHVGLVGFTPSIVITQNSFRGVPDQSVNTALGGGSHWAYWFVDGVNPNYSTAFGGYQFEGAAPISLQ